MAQSTFADRLKELKTILLAVPAEKLVEAIGDRAVYDQSLFKFLEVLGQVNSTGARSDKCFETARQYLAWVYGADDPEKRHHHDLLRDVYSVQAAIGQLFDHGLYYQVVDLFEFSLQYEDNLAPIHWPDDFMGLAYDPLAMLCLRSHLKLGKSPVEVAAIFQKMGEVDPYGLFDRLPDMRPQGREAIELAPVRKILAK